MTITLTYWSVRGLAEPIRHILRYQDEPWEENTLQISNEGFGDWMKMRDADDMPFGNLPFIEDDGKKVTQSITIMRYLGRKFGMFPTDPDDIVLAEIVEQELFDLRNKMSSACYNPYNAFGPFPGSEIGKFDHEFLKGRFAQRVSERVPKFNKILTKPFLLGDKPCYVDFLLYEFLDHLKSFVPHTFEGNDNVLAFMKRFEELPNLKEWFESEKYKEGNYINAPMAAWHGGKKE
ncbi:glutathione S-transferase Mu 1-like [Bolinopsis microptera]|uniref:glutathione S-transferase Mu 1-like n=1 Tax=Bolinopsis microptera TaxID=2820187 RepID=UPI003079FD1B